MIELLAGTYYSEQEIFFFFKKKQKLDGFAKSTVSLGVIALGPKWNSAQISKKSISIWIPMKTKPHEGTFSNPIDSDHRTGGLGCVRLFFS